jgi:hypothetical protein
MLALHIIGVIISPSLLLFKVIRLEKIVTSDEMHPLDKVIHPNYYKHLKKGAHQSPLGRQKMGWFLAD